MTKGERIAGGVFAIIGSTFFLALNIIDIVYFFTHIGFFFFGSARTVLNNIECLVVVIGIILGLVGGILLCTDKTAGGILAIIGGVIALGANILFELPIMPSFYPDMIQYGLIIAGGILGLAVGSEEY